MIRTMKEIAEAAKLQWDGGDDDRMFYDDEYIAVYANLLTEDAYDKMETEMEAEIKGVGYTVYAWNDSSGFAYWKKQGKVGDHNYIQITAHITDRKKVDPAKLRADVEKLHGKLCHWHNVDEWYSWDMDQKGKGRA